MERIIFDVNHHNLLDTERTSDPDLVYPALIVLFILDRTVPSDKKSRGGSSLPVHTICNCCVDSTPYIENLYS